MKFTILPTGTYQSILVRGFWILIIFGVISNMTQGSIIGDVAGLFAVYGWALIIIGAIKWIFRKKNVRPESTEDIKNGND